MMGFSAERKRLRRTITAVGGVSCLLYAVWRGQIVQDHTFEEDDENYVSADRRSEAPDDIKASWPRRLASRTPLVALNWCRRAAAHLLRRAIPVPTNFT